MSVSSEKEPYFSSLLPPPSSLPTLSIIIVSYNVARLLEECLSSILTRPADGLEIEVIVVDNASADGSTALVREQFPQVKLIENQHNYGFGRGCNQGVRQARGRYLFFLNPDATIEPETLRTLIDFMETHPQAGIVGPLVRYPDGTIQPTRRRFPGRGLAFIESTLLQYHPRSPFKRMAALSRFQFEDVPADQTHEVDWVVGAAFVVRRAVVDALGGLDDHFFMYSEETDFCRRAKGLGWEVWYTPAASVTHQEGQSSRQNVAARYINFWTSKLYYYRKHYGRFYAGVLRRYLLATYLVECSEQWAKLRLGHKATLRQEQLALLHKVIASGFRPYRSPYPRPASELDLCLLSAEYFPQPGGVGDYTACLAAALDHAGTGSVHVLTGKKQTETTDPPKNENFISNIYMKFPQKRYLVSELSASKIQTEESRKQVSSKFQVPSFRLVIQNWDWTCLPAIARHLHTRRVDGLNIQYQTGAYGMHPAINFLPLYLRWKLGPTRPRIVTTFHDLLVPYLFPKAGPIRRWVNQLLLRTSDTAIVTNEADYQQALAWGARPSRLRLIPIGSNIPVQPPFASEAERSAYRTSLGLTDSDFAIGYFGLTNRSKGIDTLLEAVALVRQKDEGTRMKAESKAGDNNAQPHEAGNPKSPAPEGVKITCTRRGENPKLVIIGGEVGETDLTNREYARELAGLSEKLGLAEVIIRTGHLSPGETSRTLHALDVVALPFRDGASFRRGSLLAPLAHGLPVVTTEPTNLASGSETPQLIDGQNVLLVDPANPSALAAALRQLRDDPALAARLRAGASELAQHFGWPGIAAHLLELFVD